jgi:hypothetical protein
MKVEDIDELNARSYRYTDHDDDYYRRTDMPCPEWGLAFNEDTAQYGAESFYDHIDPADWLTVNNMEEGRYRILVLNNFIAIME